MFYQVFVLKCIRWDTTKPLHSWLKYLKFECSSNLKRLITSLNRKVQSSKSYRWCHRWSNCWHDCPSLELHLRVETFREGWQWRQLRRYRLWSQRCSHCRKCELDGAEKSWKKCCFEWRRCLDPTLFKSVLSTIVRTFPPEQLY